MGGEGGALVLSILALQFADWHWDSPPREKARKTKTTQTQKQTKRGRGRGGTNNILFNGCLNENIVSHHHTERKLLAKNDTREKERARKLRDEPQLAGQVGAPGGSGAPASLPVT